jgi:hypothetical protein
MHRPSTTTIRSRIESEIITILNEQYGLSVEPNLPLRYYLDFKTFPRLVELREALNRLENGSLGQCLICNGQIAARLLEASPTRNLCPACDGTHQPGPHRQKNRVEQMTGGVVAV